MSCQSIRFWASLQANFVPYYPLPSNLFIKFPLGRFTGYKQPYIASNQISIPKHHTYKAALVDRKMSCLMWRINKQTSRRSILNQFISVFEQLYEFAGHLSFVTDLLIGQKVTHAKGNNSLQPRWSCGKSDMQIGHQPRERKEQSGCRPFVCKDGLCGEISKH